MIALDYCNLVSFRFLGNKQAKIEAMIEPWSNKERIQIEMHGFRKSS